MQENQQPQDETPVEPKPQQTVVQQPARPSKGLAITSLVLGIVSLLFALAWFIAIPLAITAIVLGSVYLAKNKGVKGGKGMAITGIILSGLALLASVLFAMLIALAVPALQEGQRDTARKNDLAVMSSDISMYQVNNRGALPEVSYIATGALIEVTEVSANGEPTQSTAVYQIGADCEGVPSEGSYNLKIKLESGDVYCTDY